MGFKKILCPVDFSACSSEALKVAAELAREWGASLVLAHVWQPSQWSFGELAPDVIQAAVDAEQAELQKTQVLAKELGVREVEARFLTGAPWDQLVSAARNDPAIDLIVMGTHGRTGLRHVVMGSVAEKVVRSAPCAVLVVRSREGK
jgi:universal stress protein A